MNTKTVWDSFKAESENVVEKVKELVREGNVRRVIGQARGSRRGRIPADGRGGRHRARAGACGHRRARRAVEGLHGRGRARAAAGAERREDTGRCRRPTMIQITDDLRLDDRDISERFVRSIGSRSQNVRKEGDRGRVAPRHRQGGAAAGCEGARDGAGRPPRDGRRRADRRQPREPFAGRKSPRRAGAARRAPEACRRGAEAAAGDEAGTVRTTGATDL